MCGIVGIVYRHESKLEIELLDNLGKLAYRGYDSAGVAFIKDSHVVICKSKGDIDVLQEKITDQLLDSLMGIGHTRWATHGKPSDLNAHPHGNGKIAVVHNGIVENHDMLRHALLAQGFHFISNTDTEVILHLLDDWMSQGKTVAESLQKLGKTLHGAFTIVALMKPGIVCGLRDKSPLVFGVDPDKFWLSSDVLMAGEHSRVYYMKEGETVEITQDRAVFRDQFGKIFEPQLEKLESVDHNLDLNGFKHYMLKEIHEQVDTIDKTLSYYEGKHLELEKPKRILIIACGTSFYAGLVAKYWFEEICGLPTDVDIASEFRYRQAPLHDVDLVIVISQSGETADVIGSLEVIKGIKTVGILNVTESTIGRMVDVVLPIKAGREIGVASTKAFMGNLCVLRFLAGYFARNAFDRKDELKQVALSVLKREPDVRQLAVDIHNARDIIFMGRGVFYPLALEGALKLKEISYINANGYPSGELKHGPIALIEEGSIVISVLADDDLLPKALSNLQEVIARGAQVIIFTNASTRVLKELPSAVILDFPDIRSDLMVFAATIPLQLLSYYVAFYRGCAIDKPRNLAKSVTVE